MLSGHDPISNKFEDYDWDEDADYGHRDFPAIPEDWRSLAMDGTPRG